MILINLIIVTYGSKFNEITLKTFDLWLFLHMKVLLWCWVGFFWFVLIFLTDTSQFPVLQMIYAAFQCITGKAPASVTKTSQSGQ